MRYEIIILLLLGGMVSATCQTQWDYCGTFTLPNILDPYYDGHAYISTPKYNIILDTNSKNILGEYYVYENYSNVYMSITNVTSGWVIDGYNPSFSGIRLSTNNSNNTGQTQSSTVKICLTGIGYNNNFTTIPPHFCVGGWSCEDQRNIAMSEFTQYYRRLWTFRSDASNSIYNFTGHTAQLNVWCNDYSQATINLTSTVGSQGNYTIQTIQQPKFFLIVDNLIPRVRQDSQNFLADNYYVQTGDGLNYTFTLQDYTGGQFYKGYLTITETVNDTVGNIHVQQFDQSNIQYVNLRPNIQYDFRVSNDVSLRDLGPVYLDPFTTNRNVVVTRPSLTSLASRWDGLNISITNNYDLSSITCTISSNSFTNGYFLVYWTGSSPYTLVSNTSAPLIQSATLTYTGNNSLQYYCTCYTNDAVYGERRVTNLVSFQNSSQYYGGFGKLSIPSNILGISKVRFLNIASVSISLLVAGLFSAISMGTGAIVFGMTIGLFYYIGYFITSPMTIGMIVFLGIMIKLSENRFGVVT